MANITYTDKVKNQTSALPNLNKVRAEDMNEIKNVVNTNEGYGLNQITNNGNTTSNDLVYRSGKLQTRSAPVHDPGRYWFDGVNWNFYDNIPGTSIQLGKELVVDVVNNNGVTFNNLEAVRYDTAVGGAPSVVRAQADTTANASGIAIMTQDLAVGATGKAVSQGLASGDTSGLVEGGRVFLSSTVAGGLTSVEQPILSFVGYCLVSDPVNGVLLVSPSGVANITALGQAIGSGQTQTLTTTPQPITAFNTGDVFELNTTVTETANAASISPASIGASGYYRVVCNVAVQITTNALLTFNIYKNGVNTNVGFLIDMRNNQTDAGAGGISAITSNIVLDTDNIEIYVNSDGTGDSIIYSSATFNIERIGNI